MSKKPTKKREPKKIKFEKEPCYCCGEEFDVYPEEDSDNPINLASNGKPWIPYGPYFIKIGTLTAMQYGPLCPECAEKEMGQRIRSRKLPSESDSFNSEEA
jgi:hypothetical protein